MNQVTHTRTVTVANRTGLHARAALLLASLAREYEVKVLLVRDSDRVDVADMIQVLSLGVRQGQELLVEVTGPQAEAALDAVVRLVDARFHEEETDAEANG